MVGAHSALVSCFLELADGPSTVGEKHPLESPTTGRRAFIDRSSSTIEMIENKENVAQRSSEYQLQSGFSDALKTQLKLVLSTPLGDALAIPDKV